jgi:hypothetical protein
MAKLIRLETDYRFYVAELTDEQLNKMEYVKDKDGGTEYYIEK